jgi:hypothetical protein
MSSKFDGKRVYELWMAARAHYLSDSYDILKYHWVFKIKDETFRIHKDRFLFERLAREYETEPVFKLALGAFFYDNPKGYLRKLIRPNFVVDQALARHDLLYINFAADYCKFQLSSAGLARLIEIDEISPESAAIRFQNHQFAKLRTYHSIRHSLVMIRQKCLQSSINTRKQLNKLLS